GGPGAPPPRCDPSDTILSAQRITYKWVDVDGDGKTDVITDQNGAWDQAAPECIDPACGLDGATSLQCRPIACRAAGLSQTQYLIPNIDPAGTWSPPGCTGRPTPVFAPTCPYGFVWSIYFNQGGNLAAPVARCSPVTLSNGRGGIMYADTFDGCRNINDG